ncbi:hypothetical protein IEQ34_020386 [Dendrobium chrysotoxum]|uniref:Uncharacterized protein n=1 Tax=Dendrobium chrysotoxum TaxID=161865 RepID=A0AAV7G0R9_DENCH|nr:hypothetical protein IEQ34_020386 [Dendrobium chrysotoxum]
MKQNGFISLKEIAAIPKPRETKKKIDMVKGEVGNKCINVGAPSGWLSGLNPGIIKHKLENQELQQHRPLDQSRSGSREINVVSNEHSHSSVADQLDLSLNKTFNPVCLGLECKAVSQICLIKNSTMIASMHHILKHFNALKKKKRVKNAIQIELPFLLTRDLAPKLENESMLLHSSLLECPRKEILDMHMLR